MSIVLIDQPAVISGDLVDSTIPMPLFSRFNAAEGVRLVVQIVGCDEDLRSIGSLPTLNRVIDWRRDRVDQPIEPAALFTLVIWNASFAQELPLSLRGGRQASSVLIAYRFPDVPPRMVSGRLTSRLRFDGSVTSLLKMLVTSLILPVAFEGLICVDYADIATAVDRGGEMALFVRRSDDIQYTTAAILRETVAHLKALEPEASVCLGLLVGSESLTSMLVDEIMHEIYKVLHPDIFVIVSAVAHSGSEASISVLTTSGDLHEKRRTDQLGSSL